MERMSGMCAVGKEREQKRFLVRENENGLFIKIHFHSRSQSDTRVTLDPMQIRTFRVKIKQKN